MNFFIFLAMWTVVTTLLTWQSGWFAAAKKYPDQKEASLLKLSAQSGSMNGVNLNLMLQLTPCRTGLRVRAFRLFFPMAVPFFVPWDEISVSEGRVFNREQVELSFGRPRVNRLTVSAAVADRLFRAAGDCIPEGVSIPSIDAKALARESFLAWFLLTSLFSAFFIAVPRITKHAGPPIAVAVGLPALIFGFRSLIKFWGLVQDDHK